MCLRSVRQFLKRITAPTQPFAFNMLRPTKLSIHPTVRIAESGTGGPPLRQPDAPGVDDAGEKRNKILKPERTLDVAQA